MHCEVLTWRVLFTMTLFITIVYKFQPDRLDCTDCAVACTKSYVYIDTVDYNCVLISTIVLIKMTVFLIVLFTLTVWFGMCDLFTMIIMSRSNYLLVNDCPKYRGVLLAITSLLTMTIMFSVSSCLESFVYNDTVDYNSV